MKGWCRIFPGRPPTTANVRLAIVEYLDWVRAGQSSAAQGVFAAADDDRQAIEEALALLKRLSANTAPLHRSEF